MMRADVTVSVWNRFWSFELVSGLIGAAYRVCYVGTSRWRSAAQTHRTCWLASCLTLASHRVIELGLGEGVSAWLSDAALPIFENYASRYAAMGRCFWGWSGHNLEGFRRAKEAGVPAILETGSTHALWRKERLASEYKKRGVIRPLLEPERVEKPLREYELADRIVVPSRFVETTFLDAGASADKLIVNPFGVDTSFWAVNRGAPISRPFRVIYAASLILRKGIAYLLEAWKQAELRDAQLLLAGSIGDEARPFLKALPDNVVLLGFMEHGRLRETYGDCDLYVLPSLEEGMARSALEAMAAGLPLVVTRETGMTDIMMDGEDGFVVPAMDVDALVHVLRSAADDRGRLPAMGRSAQIRVSRFSWKAYGQRCGDVLKGLIGSPAAVNRLHA